MHCNIGATGSQTILLRELVRLGTFLLATIIAADANGDEFHVAIGGDDAGSGSATQPFKTITAAARRAQPGDTITVHEGIYRERIDPPRGGSSDAARIIYRAAPGETVAIKGSEVVKKWDHVQGNVWKTTLPNTLFGQFNPYADVIRGDWFDGRGRTHHTGAIYLDGHWLAEAATIDEVLNPTGDAPQWFGRVDPDNTMLWARFKGVDPNKHLVEINARQTVFYPSRPGINYITVRGFTLEHAATPWAPPTAQQIGLIGAHWCRGWIIEDNVVRYSRCSGIALGKYGDEFDNTSANTAEGYVETIKRALERGWQRGTVGHHIVRRNLISHCEQTGIVGSMGCAFSVVTGNVIHDIHVQRLFGGAEMAAIKFHGAVDVEISHNQIHHSNLGLWLDWMAQGTRVTANLFHHNYRDLFLEVNHGPYVIDNNVFLSANALDVQSDGGLFAFNLIAGAIVARPEVHRSTPSLEPHSTKIVDLRRTPVGDVRFFHNVLVGPAGLDGYDEASTPVAMMGNVFLNNAKPSRHERGSSVGSAINPQLQLVENAQGCSLQMIVDDQWLSVARRQPVNAGLTGRTAQSRLSFEYPDGSPLAITTDYLARQRPGTDPLPGPFEAISRGKQTLAIWPPAQAK